MPSRTSLDSSAPIMAPSAAPSTAPPSNRTSIFGTQTPQPRPLGPPQKSHTNNLSRTDTTSTTGSRQTLSSPRALSEIQSIEQGLDKLENKKLGQQRYVPSPMKEEGMQALKLGAKLERALGRRLGGQDAVMRPRAGTVEKAGIQA